LGCRPADVLRFLPALAIAAAREHQYQAAKRSERAADVLRRLRDPVQADEDAADLVARSGCAAWDHGDAAQSRDLYELVRGCRALRKNPWLIELARHHRR
jgi:hypothetical protein